MVRGFNPASLAAVETDAETLTHELGHATGLMHVNPEGASAVMDYDHLDGVTETFQNDVFEITHPPVEGGRVLPATHNPLYHLRRYTDGIPHEELETMGIVPGTWDLPGDINLPIVLQFVFGTSVTAPSSPTGTVSAAIQSDL